MKHKYIVALLIFLLVGNISLVVCDENSEFRNEIISSLKTKSVSFYCDNNWIINEMGNPKLNCEELIYDYSEQCGELISPLIPLLPEQDEYSDREYVQVKKKWDNIGKLFSICIQGKAFSDKENR
ncbi:MAG: hypothetical protein JAZ17_07375 [Candidatus Thiodiazotropha endolucinida]|nr:hypothetical protein [Candidatus Thiodiazotropha taylori]MCG8093437.1 hypothetical protein [Candidatus Thiodiazotropha endolucinida]MCW4277100.1 hypothetical protein [Candidatus Thiodiazotropha taylori]